MSVKVAFLVESFVTQLAEKWFFTSVNTHVNLQVGGRHETLVTNEASYKIALSWKKQQQRTFLYHLDTMAKSVQVLNNCKDISYWTPTLTRLPVKSRRIPGFKCTNNCLHWYFSDQDYPSSLWNCDNFLQYRFISLGRLVLTRNMETEGQCDSYNTPNKLCLRGLQTRLNCLSKVKCSSRGWKVKTSF